MHVRPATAADAAAISAVARQTFALACPPGTPQGEIDAYIRGNLGPDRFAAALGNPAQQLWVLEHDGQVAGYSLVDHAAAALGIAAADGLAELSRCYVAPQHHGQGAAQALLAATLASVPGPVRLTVNDQNPRAIAFYRRNGFVQVGETQFLCGADVHRDWVMVRAG
ncbi:GNAT family N-acetyltransferase [Pseudomonas sp. NPDC007930]|uniref:GNAT family N-acetyltransferase n=1 Tax=Pseudomonas sp. NPDC007930 TaxID=3364417 RepID=UPI0036E6BB31